MDRKSNFQTKMTFDEAIWWLQQVRDGHWDWTSNSRCKYVDLYIDTRHGFTMIKDRDGHEISFTELIYQYERETGKKYPC